MIRKEQKLIYLYLFLYVLFQNESELYDIFMIHITHSL